MFRNYSFESKSEKHSFDINQVDLSIVNGIRRTILTDIPVVGFIGEEEPTVNIIANNGSIQQLDFLSQHMKDKYKIVWEIPMKHIINMARDRGIYICQSQSMNLWIEEPNYGILTSMHMYSWKCGLKTGIYYLRRKAKHQAQQFTIMPEKEKEEEECLMCGA